MGVRVPGLILALALASPALAEDAVPWRVSEVGGPVTIVHDGRTARAARNTILAPGDSLLTGPGGRALVVHGGDVVMVSPATSLSIPRDRAPQGFFEIVESYGRALYMIEKQAVPHFRVKTPLLAATVRGTVFTVDADDDGARVAVTEGRVEVAAAGGGAPRMVEAGLTGAVAAADPDEVDLHASAGGGEAALAPGAGGAPQLSYAGADAAETGESDCGSACAPRLAYAPVNPAADMSAPAIAAASAPAPLPALDAGAMRSGTDGTQLLAAVDSARPADQELAGLVTIAATAPAPAPATAPAPAPGPATVPTPAPAPGIAPPLVPGSAPPPAPGSAPPRSHGDDGDDQGDDSDDDGGSNDGNGPAPSPTRVPPPAHAPAFAPAPAPAPAPTPPPDPKPPVCLLKLICL